MLAPPQQTGPVGFKEALHLLPGAGEGMLGRLPSLPRAGARSTWALKTLFSKFQLGLVLS